MVLLTWIVVIVALAAVIAYLWAWRQAPEELLPPRQAVPREPSLTFGTPFLEPTLTLGTTPCPPEEEKPAAETPAPEPPTEEPAPPAPGEEEPKFDPEDSELPQS